MRRTLVKLRIGCHNLRVATGRYEEFPLEERICPLCSDNKIEDETHLLLKIFLDETHSFSKLNEKLIIFENYRMIDITTDEL